VPKTVPTLGKGFPSGRKQIGQAITVQAASQSSGLSAVTLQTGTRLQCPPAHSLQNKEPGDGMDREGAGG